MEIIKVKYEIKEGDVDDDDDDNIVTKHVLSIILMISQPYLLDHP